MAQAERVFSTEIVTNAGGWANNTDPRIPARLAGTIGAIFGLSGQPGGYINSSALESADVPAATSARTSSHFTPHDFWTYYDQSPPLTPGNNGGTSAGDCIGLQENYSLSPGVLDAFASTFNLPPMNLTFVLTDPAHGTPIPTSDETHEAELDAEWAHAVAPNTPIVVYLVNGSCGPEDPFRSTTGPCVVFDGFNLAVTSNTCGTISTDAYQCATEAEIAVYFEVESQAVAQGQTLFHASGGFGSFWMCGQPSAHKQNTGVQPSIAETFSSPDVTLVGGTQFVAGGNGTNTTVLKPGQEAVWNVYPTVTATPNPTPVPYNDGSARDAWSDPIGKLMFNFGSSANRVEGF